MLTRSGWLTVLLGAVLAGAGRVLGLPELDVLAAAAACVLILAIVTAGLRRPRLGASRHMARTRVHAGDECAVDLRIRNRGRRRTPVLELHDPVDTTPGVSVLLAPLGARARITTRYRMPTERRGRIEVGPLRVRWLDPFGLVARSRPLTDVDGVIVYPPLVEVPPAPRARGIGPVPSSTRPDSLGRVGDDFYALRAYVSGDDPRRIHWPSTARHGDLMVRQAHHPTTSRTTVLVDDRTAALPPAGLDLATSIAASVLAAAARRGDEIRLVTTCGLDSGYGGDNHHLLALFEHLALLDATEAVGIDAGLIVVTEDLRPCSLVAITGTDPEAGRVDAARDRIPGELFHVVVHPSAWDPEAPAEPVPLAGPTVDVTGARDFAAAWHTALEHHRTGVGA